MLRLLGGEFGSLGLFEGGTHSGSEKRRYGELKKKCIYLAVLDLSCGTQDL